MHWSNTLTAESSTAGTRAGLPARELRRLILRVSKSPQDEVSICISRTYGRLTIPGLVSTRKFTPMPIPWADKPMSECSTQN